MTARDGAGSTSSDASEPAGDRAEVRAIDAGDPVLALVAPGTALRDAIERLVQARRGALFVLGTTSAVEAICSGGFTIDVEASGQRIAELAKMDGAIVLDASGQRILRANVQLAPDPSVPTEETGIRHRSAERTARQTGVPVVAVSEAMARASLFHDGRTVVLEGP